MSKKNPRKFHPNNLPARLPIWPAAIIWLVLDRTQPPGWVWGAVGVFVVLWFIGAVIAFAKEDWIDYFNNGN